jgi:DNA-binding XRE family transcriptional regulator
MPATTKRIPMERLVDTIRDYQERYELSDARVAEKLGVPRTTWTAIRNGQYPPRLEFAQAAARTPEFRATAIEVLVPPEGK